MCTQHHPGRGHRCVQWLDAVDEDLGARWSWTRRLRSPSRRPSHSGEATPNQASMVVRATRLSMAVGSDGRNGRVPSEPGQSGQIAVIWLGWRALLDSNQWPSASETARGESTNLPESSLPSSNRTVSPDAGSQATRVNPFLPKDLATPLLPAGADRPLLTVREVATALGVCTATVYKLCHKGDLRHVRVLHAIRVASSDLDAFIGRRRDAGSSASASK